MNRWYITIVRAEGSSFVRDGNNDRHHYGDYSEATVRFDEVIGAGDILYAQLHHEDGEVRRQFVRSAPDVEVEVGT